jgi:hypothetical protein
MSAELLLLAVLAAMTCVALMIAINSRGRWRATLSSLMAVCMLGGTIWVFTLQYNLMDAFEAPGDRAERRRADAAAEEHTSLRYEHANHTAMIRSLIAEATQFADALTKERMHDPLLSHNQLVARADAVEQRYETLRRDIDRSAQILERFPEAAKLLGEAMTDLKAASHFFRAYYYAENSEAEMSTERLMRQRARNAHDTLARAARAARDT